MSRANKVKYRIITPEAIVSAGEVDMIVVPGMLGDIGVLPGHMPMISSLRVGAVCLFDNNAVTQRFLVDAGVIEINEHSCIVLADTAQNFEDVDIITLEVSKTYAEDIYQSKVDQIKNLINDLFKTA